MKIKFYLKRAKAPGKIAIQNAIQRGKRIPKFNPNSQTAIYALINYNAKSLKISTGESIIPKFWNSSTNSARNTEKFSEHPEFNERLNQIRSVINRIFLDYKNKNDNTEPSIAALKPLVKSALKSGIEKTTFINYFESFVRRSFAGQRFDPRSKKPIRMGVAKGYQTTLNHLKNFAQIWKRKIDFDTIDLEFHNDFTEFLTISGKYVHPKTRKERFLHLSANSIGSHFQRIKAVLSEATERGINKNLSFKSKLFIKQNEESDPIYLTESELNDLSEIDLSSNKRLDNVRDLFLIGANTGLRYSDFSILKPENIKDNRIRITQTKTGDPVIIPLHRIIKNILSKRKGELPRGISNEKMNLYLKEIGAKIPSLKKIERASITKGGNLITRDEEKWKKLTTHTARRSFASNWYKRGVPSITIMAITGHKTEKSFLKYIRVTPEEHADIFQVHMDKEEKNNLKAI